MQNSPYTTPPERRAHATARAAAHAASLAAAQPHLAEKVTQTTLQTLARIAPQPPHPDMRSRLPVCRRAGAFF